MERRAARAAGGRAAARWVAGAGGGGRRAATTARLRGALAGLGRLAARVPGLGPRLAGRAVEIALPDDPEYCSSCVIPTDWAEVPLLRKKRYSHDSSVFTFGLPRGQSLSLPVCACLLMRGFDAAGQEAVRPYTPTSSNDVQGSFDLLVKVYENGVVSKWLDGLELGTPVGFKHIPFNIKAQYPADFKKNITMVAGGTGITPMYQALQCIAKNPDDTSEVTLLYGNKSPEDILLRSELDALAAKSGGRIKVVHVVGTAPDQGPIEGWDGELGWVDEAKFVKYAAPPSEDTLVMVCGLPGLYDAFCGPRTEAGVQKRTILHKLGYTAEMVAKF